jgi:hypothetical protein
VTKAQAIGHLHLLWWWSLDYAPDGNLSPFTELEIATAAEWTRDAGKFVAALLDSKLLDNGPVIHDWHSYAGKLIASRNSNARRQREHRERLRNCDITVTSHKSNGLQYPTVPNSTQPNPTNTSLLSTSLVGGVGEGAEAPPIPQNGRSGCPDTNGQENQQGDAIPLNGEPSTTPETPDEKAPRKRFVAPTEPELLLLGAKIGLPETEVRKFLTYYESNGWRVGRNPMKSVPHALSHWKLRWQEHSRAHRSDFERGF